MAVANLQLTGLAEDLKVWLPGLLPLFKYASLVTKVILDSAGFRTDRSLNS
jgi:hypothetical protein